MDRLIQPLMLVVVAAALWVGAKLAEPAVNRWQVQRFVDQIAINAVHPRYYDRIEENIQFQAASRGLPFAPSDLRIEVDDKVLRSRVSVSYWRETDLLTVPFFTRPVIEYGEDGVLIWRDSRRSEKEGIAGRLGLRMARYDLSGTHDRTQNR